MPNGIALNARFYSHRMTGMQRYAAELATRFGEKIDRIQPARPLKGAAGHLWEQAYLPLATHGRLLWSPNNTGPVSVSHQVCTIHDLIPLERPEWFNPRFSAWYRWLFPRLAKRVAHVIAISEFTKSRVMDLLHVPERKITVIPNGVNRFQRAQPSEIAQMRQEFNLGQHDYLLCLGSLEPRKNVKRLLRAWSRVQPTLSRPVRLVIAGGQASKLVFSDPGLPATNGQVDSSVQFIGYVRDEQLPALYSGALAMIYPSLYEGFGLPPLEAMSCGTPVVTSRTTSLPEVVGKAAVLVDPEDEESIADGITQIVQNSSLRNELSLHAVARSSLYSWETSANSTWKLLEAFAG